MINVKKSDDLKRAINWHEQYSPRNCILVHSIKVIDTDVVVTEALNELLQEKFIDADIDQSHRTGKRKNGKHPMPIFTMFASYNIRYSI